MLLHEFEVGELASLLNGGWIIPPKCTHAPVLGLSTDSRNLQQGDVFLALSGDNFDGHDYVVQAVKGGCSALIVSDIDCLGKFEDEGLGDAVNAIPVLRVSDTLIAYGDLANALRRRAGRSIDNRPGAVFIGVAGSNGKTTTKELLADILELSFGHDAVLRSPANNNNLIGVPQTLLRLKREHRFVVIEVGMNQPGELMRLAKILAPDIALMTNIGAAHIGEFASPEEHFNAKLDWLQYAPAKATLLLNSDNEGVRRAEERLDIKRTTHHIGAFAEDSIAKAHRAHQAKPLGYRFQLDLFGRHLKATLPVFGHYNIENAVMAAAAASLAGASDEDIVRGIGKYVPYQMRGEIRDIGGRKFVVDCYNASPEAVSLALDSLHELAASEGARAFALLGEMAELGALGPEAHREVGRAAARANLQGLFTYGDMMTLAKTEAASLGLDGVHIESLDDIGPVIMNATRPGDAILIKGSRSCRLEDSIPDLLALGSNAASQVHA